MDDEIINEDDFKDINVGAYGEVLPPKTDKIALIDADTLVYTAALAAESKCALLDKDSYSPDEWTDIISNPSYDEGEHCIYESDLDTVVKLAKEKLQKILDRTGCEKYQLHFTMGKASFRYHLYNEYKMNRRYVHRPVNLVEAKQWFIENDCGYGHDDIEADDAVVWLKKHNLDKYILCCVDKDVYNAVEGIHFNYYESGKYNKDMHWVTTEAESARMWPYMQAIIGDKSDNVIGLHGIGPAKVKKLIRPDGDLKEQLIKAFVSAGRTEEDALLNLVLVTCGDDEIMKDSKLFLYKDKL